MSEYQMELRLGSASPLALEMTLKALHLGESPESAAMSFLFLLSV